MYFQGPTMEFKGPGPTCCHPSSDLYKSSSLANKLFFPSNPAYQQMWLAILNLMTFKEAILEEKKKKILNWMFIFSCTFQIEFCVSAKKKNNNDEFSSFTNTFRILGKILLTIVQPCIFLSKTESPTKNLAQVQGPDCGVLGPRSRMRDRLGFLLTNIWEIVEALPHPIK